MEHRAEQTYKWTAADIVGNNISLLFPPNTTTQFTTGFTHSIEQGAWQSQLDQVTHSGKLITVESRWTLVKDKSGQPHSILVVNTDITEKKQLEAQFYRVQRIESLGMLASSIAHDLNNVFAAILSATDLQLLRQDLDQENYEHYQIISRSGHCLIWVCFLQGARSAPCKKHT